MSRFQIYALLGAAIIAEVVGTTALARSAGLTRLGPTAVAAVTYAVAFWLLSLTLQVLPTGIVYAIWSGLGVVLIAGVAWIWQGQVLDLPAVVGLTLIIAGVAVVNLFSGTVGH